MMAAVAAADNKRDASAAANGFCVSITVSASPREFRLSVSRLNRVPENKTLVISPDRQTEAENPVRAIKKNKKAQADRVGSICFFLLPNMFRNALVQNET